MLSPMPGAADQPEKTKLRAEMRACLRVMSPEAVACGSAAIVARLEADARWREGARVVAFFGGLKGEPDLLSLLPCLHRRGIMTALFAVEGERLVPFAVSSPDEFEDGAFGVWVPRPGKCERLAVAHVSVVLTPGLAFCARDGARLGRGAGFYDRFFAHPEMVARRIGVCFEAQLLEQVPSEPHDAPMHQIVTEARLVRCLPQ